LIETPVITLDVDWAPDFVLEKVFRMLEEVEVKSTWFVTHDSPLIRNLQNNSLFEIGIHPNFHASSTQGKNFEEIMRNMKKIVPKAKSIRTHDLLQSSSNLLQYHKFGIENDVSLLLELSENLHPHYSRYFNLFRFPFFWEDDVEMHEKQNWDISTFKFHEHGLKIFNFHPIHIYLNSKNMTNYNIIKNEIGLKKIRDDDVSQYINSEKGVKTFFLDLLNTINPKESFTIDDLHNLFFEK